MSFLSTLVLNQKPESPPLETVNSKLVKTAAKSIRERERDCVYMYVCVCVYVNIDV
jgi:hypothetical protein